MKLQPLACTLFGIIILQVRTFEITGYTRYSQGKPKTQVRVSCSTDKPIDDCEFRSINDEQQIDWQPVNGVFSCGVDTELENGEVQILACRVRNNQSNWLYREMLVYASDKEEFPYSFPTQVIEGVNGNRATIVGSSSLPLSKCQFTIPGEEGLISFNEGRDTNISEHLNYEYYGQGLGRGECGIVIKSISESGFVYSYVETTATRQGHTSSDFLTLIVAPPLVVPELSVMDATYKKGDRLKANCSAAGSPVPDMKWYLGEELVRGDDVDYGFVEHEWWWSYMPKFMMQNISVPINVNHDQVLRCVISQPTLSDSTSETTKTIHVESSTAKIIWVSIAGVLLAIVLIALIYGYYKSTLCFSGKCRDFFTRKFHRQVMINEDDIESD